jgi:4-hydroxy-tetrahydrodipicolinate reductase
MKKILVIGACGRMGQEVVRTILQRKDMELSAAVDLPSFAGADIGEMAAGRAAGVAVSGNLERTLESGSFEAAVEFTTGKTAPSNILACLLGKIPVVSGTTGIEEKDLLRIRKESERTATPVLVAPNFSIGAVLMMKFSALASRYFPAAEIIELHHEKKLDFPSGTALRTAELMLGERERFVETSSVLEKLPQCRGGTSGGIHIHSVRLPGLLAHQEVIFGREGETLMLRHDSISRVSFMEGILLAIRRVSQLQGLTIGLENLLE